MARFVPVFPARRPGLLPLLYRQLLVRMSPEEHHGVMTDSDEADQSWRTSINQSDDRPGVWVTEEWRASTSNVFRGGTFGNEEQTTASGYGSSDDYVRDVQIGIGVARSAYRRLIRISWCLKLTAIVSGALVAVFAATSSPKWIMGALGAVSAIVSSVLASGRFQEQAVVRGTLADRMARELRGYLLSLDVYSGTDSLNHFHRRIESLRDEATGERFRLDVSNPTENLNGGEGGSG